MMRLPYLTQLKRKAAELEQTLGKRYLERGAALAAMVTGEERFGTRISAKLVLDEGEDGLRRVGLFRQGTRTVVAIPGCVVHHAAIRTLLDRVPLTGRLPAPFYKHGERGFQAGRLKFLTMRVAPDTGLGGIVVSHTGVSSSSLREWLRPLMMDTCVYSVTLKESDRDRILSDHVEHLGGPETISYSIGSARFALTPLVFFQNNAALAHELVARTARVTGKKDTLLDLYGGIGAYGFKAEGFKRIMLAELDGGAIAVAKAHPGKLSGTEYVAAAVAVEEFLKGLVAKDAARVTHAIVNPPRRGISATVARMLLAPKFTYLHTLHYVSCSMESLRTDLDRLTERGGFRVASVTPFDMFPQTAHLETLTVLTRR